MKNKDIKHTFQNGFKTNQELIDMEKEYNDSIQMKTQFITTRFPEDLAEKLKAEAKKTERSAGAVIRLAVTAYLERL